MCVILSPIPNGDVLRRSIYRQATIRAGLSEIDNSYNGFGICCNCSSVVKY